MTFEEHIIDVIQTTGKDLFLRDIIDDDGVRIGLIDKFLEDRDVYCLLKSVNDYVNTQLLEKLKKTLRAVNHTPDPYDELFDAVDFHNAFRVPYNRAQTINALVSSGRTPYIQPITRIKRRPSRGHAWGMFNSYRRTRINPDQVYSKPKCDIVKAVKAQAQEFFHKNPTFDGGIIGFEFVDLFGHHMEITLDELDITQTSLQETEDD